MKTMTAAEAKNAFGKFLDMAQREPVVVTKMGRPVGAFISIADLENTVWGERALAADKDGYVGVEASEDFLNCLLNASD